MTVLRAQRVVALDRVMGPGEVVIEGGTIVEVRPAEGPVEDVTICPGFVDLQVNGMDDIDVAHARGDDWTRLGELLAATGVTTWLPTLITTTDDRYQPAIAEIAAAASSASGDRPYIAGVHLEGPFIARLGAHDPALARSSVDQRWIDELDPLVRMVTLAPELPGALDAIVSLRERGVVAALGHTDATASQTEAAIDAGATVVTHCFNGIPAIGARAPGPSGAALVDERVAVTLIADGVHVDVRLLRLAFRSKGAARVALVTDAVAWRAGRLGERAVALVDGAPRLEDGTLAGSALTMDRAVATCVSAGISLHDAVTAACATPADVLGLTDRGRLAPGQRADIVVLDRDHRAIRTWIGGALTMEQQHR